MRRNSVSSPTSNQASTGEVGAPPGSSPSTTASAGPSASLDRQDLLNLVLNSDDAGLAASFALPQQRAAARAARYRSGRTLLHVAASTGRPATIAAVRDAGVDGLQPDDDGFLPLHVALGWRREMRAALAAEVRCAHDHGGHVPQSAPAEAWVKLLPLGTCRLSAIEALLVGSEQGDRAFEAPLLRTTDLFEARWYKKHARLQERFIGWYPFSRGWATWQGCGLWPGDLELAGAQKATTDECRERPDASGLFANQRCSAVAD